VIRKGDLDESSDAFIHVVEVIEFASWALSFEWKWPFACLFACFVDGVEVFLLLGLWKEMLHMVMQVYVRWHVGIQRYVDEGVESL
jgi:hypothetical protein